MVYCYRIYTRDVPCTVSVVIKHGLHLPGIQGFVGDYQQLGNSHAKKTGCQGGRKQADKLILLVGNREAGS